MAEEMKIGCARPTGGTVKKGPDEDVSEQHQEKEMTSKEDAIMIQVGKQAPEFTAPAYHKGTFISTNLSEYLGNWVVLCFYPGDFTFV